MNPNRLVKNHDWRLMRNQDIYPIRDERFWMVVRQPEETNPVNLTASVLQKMDILRQVLNILCIPQAQIMITRNKYLMLVRQHDEPVEEIKHLLFAPHI